MKKKNIKLIISGIIIIVGLATGVITYQDVLKEIGLGNLIKNNQNVDYSNIIKYRVESIVDGDTFKIIYNGKTTKVRLIGVDTPESVSANKKKNNEYGKQASNYTKERLEGKEVLLEFDIQQTDKYGRLLAYVYLEDGTMYNKELLEKGYAQIATYPPNVKYVDEFKEIQKKAKENKTGFWAKKVF